jgi:hypothetical protein
VEREIGSRYNIDNKWRDEMAQWMKAHDGSYVNLAHAVRVKRMRSREHPGAAAKPRWVWGVELPDGEMVETNEEGHDVGDFLATIVPAQPGQEAVAVGWDSDARPTELWVTRLPIIAWRIELKPDYVPRPVFPDQDFDGVRTFIVLPDGRLLEPYVGEHDSLDAMKAALLEEAQRDWDAAQATKAAKA